MANEDDHLRQDLAALGARIQSKLAELRAQGLLHGPAREEAADLEIRQAHLMRRAANGSVSRTISDEIAVDVAILKHAFERWLARTDGAAEGHVKR